MRRAPLLALPVLLPAPPSPAADEYKPNENLVTDGIPPLPTALAEQVHRYTEFRSAGLFDWHPTSGKMLVGTRFAQTRQVHVVKFRGGARTQLTFFAEGVAGAKYQPTKGDYFVFSRDVGGNERYQNFRYDLATGDVTPLTDGKSRNSLGVWSKAGDRMAYTSTRRNGKDTDIYLINPTDPKSDKLLAQVEGSFSVLDWSPDGTSLLAEEYLSANESYLWLIDAKTGAKSRLTPAPGETKEKLAYSGGQFSPDGSGVWTTSDRAAEFHRLTRIDIATKNAAAYAPNM